MKKIRIGTRGSQLALKQTGIVIEQILSNTQNITRDDIEIVRIKTTGDKIQNKKISDIGGKSLFTKEIELSLLNNEIDIAVHSLKDFTYKVADGLEISAVMKRENSSDALISTKYRTIDDLPKNAIIGTSAIRREYQILSIRPDLVILPIRGNIITRINKYYENTFDAIILATAGLKRLDIDENVYNSIPISQMLPAPGQGAICIQHRKGDSEFFKICQKINDPDSFICSEAERSFIECLEADCTTPIAALAEIIDGIIFLEAEIFCQKTKRRVTYKDSDEIKNATKLGVKAAAFVKQKINELVI